MNIRTLTVEDSERYQKLRLQGLKHNPEAFGSSYETEVILTPEELQQRLHDRLADGNVILGAEIQGELVGMIGLSREKGPKVEHKAFVWGVYVAQQMRGQGFGKVLLDAIIAYARTLSGLEQLTLGVAVHNTPARKLYLSRGFEVFGVEKHALKLNDTTYIDEELMVLFL